MSLRKRGKTVPSVLIAAILILCFAGVYAQAAETITVYGPWPDVADTIRDLYNQFTAQTGIKVKWEPAQTDFPSHVTKITTLLSSGDGSYDVIWLDDQIVCNAGKAGWLEPLEGKYALPKGYLDDWPAGVVHDSAYVNGKLYRVIGQVEAMWTFYRKDLYKKAGVAPPATWDELVQVGKKLTSGEGGAGKRWGLLISGQKGGMLSNELTLYMLQAGGSSIDYSLPGSKVALQFMYDLVYKHHIAPESSFATDYNLAAEGFKKGIWATWFTWQGFYSVFKSDKQFIADAPIDDKVGVTRALKGPANDYTISGSWGWTINKFSRHKNAALKFILFLSSVDAQKAWAKAGRPPARLSVMKDSELWKVNPPNKLWSDYGSTVRGRPLMTVPRTNEVMEAQEDWAHKFLTGQVDINTALTQGDKAMKAIMKE
ncbi:MAG: extracellular solute-binding protein [Firmicutes bacterium]|nr:extracellular solute-binding protein [Bacillota bacterium]